MDNIFIFKNKATDKIEKRQSYAMNPAMRQYPPLDKGDGWQPWECWSANSANKLECIWHYTDAGDCLPGPRDGDQGAKWQKALDSACATLKGAIRHE